MGATGAVDAHGEALLPWFHTLAFAPFDAALAGGANGTAGGTNGEAGDRVVDVLLSEGPKVLYRFGIALVRLRKAALKDAATDAAEVRRLLFLPARNTGSMRFGASPLAAGARQRFVQNPFVSVQLERRCIAHSYGPGASFPRSFFAVSK